MFHCAEGNKKKEKFRLSHATKKLRKNYTIKHQTPKSIKTNTNQHKTMISIIAMLAIFNGNITKRPRFASPHMLTYT